MTQTPLAMVTGASRGLGAAFAESLGARGFHVIAVARTTGALEELDDRIKAAGGQATLAPMDICNADAMAHLCRAIHDRWGGLDLWVHTAIHAPPLAPAAHIDAKDMDKSIDTNIRALSRLITFVDPLLRARQSEGKAVFFDDAWGKKFAGSYGSTKTAQRVLIESWQAENTTANAPRVSLLSPPAMTGALRARFFPGEDQSTLAKPKTVASELVEQIL